VYLALDSDAPFSVHVHARKPGRYGGAALIDPNGREADHTAWNQDGAAEWHTVKGRGKGVWRLDQSGIAHAQHVRAEGIAPYGTLWRSAAFVVARPWRRKRAPVFNAPPPRPE